MDSELACWMEWIENSMADDAFETPTIDDLDEFIGGQSYLFVYLLKPPFPKSEYITNIEAYKLIAYIVVSQYYVQRRWLGNILCSSI